MSERLRVGVVGLGRLWEARYKPAFLRLAHRFEVTCVYDQVGQRTIWEARQLDCLPSGGITDLVTSPFVDVVVQLTTQWFGLYPAELACDAGKPVFASIAWDSQGAQLESMAQKIRSSGSIFVPEMPRREYPATTRLRELLDRELGPARLVIGHVRVSGYDRYGDPGPTTQLSPAPLAYDPGCNLIDWSRHVIQSEPIRVNANARQVLTSESERGDADFQTIHIDFENGSVAQFTLVRHDPRRLGEANRILPDPGIQVFTERGAAWVEPPERLRWASASEAHNEELSLSPTVGERLLTRLYEHLWDESPACPTLDDALAALRWANKLPDQEATARSEKESSRGERS